MQNHLRLTIICALSSGVCLSAFAQGTAITYQGRLNNNGAPYTGNAEFQPTLWDSVSGAAQVATNNPPSVTVGVTNGLFVLPLDFGANFPGADRWLQLDVRTTNDPFTTLAPRQRLTPAPYAITASNLAGVLPVAQLSGALSSANLAGTYFSPVTFSNAANSFTGNGSGLTSLNASQLASGTIPMAALSNAWRISGNSGASPTNGNFIGTTDNQPLELRVNGQRALRIEPNTNNAPNMIGGSPGNFVAPGVVGSVIAGGGLIDQYDDTNSVYAGFSVIGGGVANTIQTRAIGSTIDGGSGNTIQSDANYSTISGGVENTIQTNAYNSTISGGLHNSIQTSADNSTIGGGGGNTIQSDANYATIGGGVDNAIQFAAYDSTIGGGAGNTIQPNASDSTIGGGEANTIASDALCAAIPGGYNNTADGYFSFAAGYRAKALHDGSFVWADSTGTGFASTANNQFSVLASGGALFVTGNGGLKLGSSGQFFAPGGAEKLRIIRGVVDSAGNALHGADFNVTRTGTGAYTIAFSSAFTDFPALTVSAQSGLPRYATTTNVSTTGAQIRTFDSTGAAVDAQFHFIAIGTQ